MTKENLTQRTINRAKPKEKEYLLPDHVVDRLFYRVLPSGHTSWVVKYRDPKTKKYGQKFTLSVPSNLLEDARKEARKFFQELSAGVDPQEKKEKEIQMSLTLAEALELYKPLILGNLRSGANVVAEIANTCKWRNLGNTPINSIKQSDITAFKNDLLNAGLSSTQRKEKRGLTKRSVNKKVSQIYTMMQKLYDEGLVKESDVALPPKPKKMKEDDSDKSRSYFEPKDRQKLIEAAKATREPEWLYPAIIISLNTGMRPGTLFRLRWGDVDFKSETIHLRAAIMKTKDDWRIPYNGHVKEMFNLIRARRECQPEDFVLLDANGHGIRTTAGNNGWEVPFAKLCKQCGIKNKTWYNMRHDFASQLVMKGVDIYTVASLMCHKNITTTQIYAHLAPDLKKKAVEQLDTL